MTLPNMRSYLHSISPRTITTVIAAVLVVLGGTQLVLQQFNLKMLEALTETAGKPLTHLALGSFLAGCCLWLQRVPLNSTPSIFAYSARRFAKFVALLVTLLGLFTLAQTFFGLGESADQFLAAARLDAYSFRTGSVSYLSGLCFVLSGVSLMLLDQVDHKGRYLAEYFALAIALLMIVPVIGMLYGSTSLIQMTTASPVSMQAPFVFLLLTLGIMSARPEHPLMALFLGSEPGGLMIRRLLPAVLLLLIVLDLLAESGARHGLYNADMVSPLSILVDMGLIFILFLRAAVLLNADHKVRLQGEAALARSNRLIRAVSDNTADAIFVKNREGRLIFGNPALARLIGTEISNAIGRNSRELLGDAQLGAKIEEHDKLVMQSGVTQVLEETMQLQGKTYTYHTTKSPWIDEHGEILGIVGISTDITDRKRMEEALKEHEVQLETLVAARTTEVSELVGHLENTRENEKRAIARELHDDLGSSLTALSMHLAILFQKMPTDPGVTERAVQVKALLNSVTATTRRIQNGLRPDKLDIFGVKTAISDQAMEFEQYTGIGCKTSLPDEEISYSPLVEINLFRIVQEALNNIAKHAQADHVDIILDDNDDNVALTIRDNGVGIAPAGRRYNATHGLRGMRERVTYLGGRFAISSEPGKGTKIQITIPKTRNDNGDLETAEQNAEA